MQNTSASRWNFLPYLFWSIAGIRLFFNAVLPLMDQTEARYGNIARIMAETQEWVVLQIDYGIPFWAKPPLSTWAAAISLHVLGNSEFAVRLPYFLVCLGLAFWVNRYRRKDHSQFYLLPLLVLTLPEFYLHAGVVSTDVFLALSIVFVMFGFWETLHGKHPKLWGYLFFVGLGLGMLAKGPIVGILTLPPLVVWMALTKNIKKAFISAPWILGMVLFVGIFLPWYLMAENRSPGFLDYFVVGEHFNRFFNSAWKGDRYGFPKQQPLGIIWIFLIGFTLPWSVLLLSKIRVLWNSLLQNPWRLFLVLWLVWTPLFFTISKSLIHPYILPVMVPFALLVYEFWPEVKKQNTYLALAGGLPFILLVVYFSGALQKVIEDSTDKYLVEPSEWVYSLDAPSYSSRFYTEGKITRIDSLQLDSLYTANSTARILIRHRTYALLSSSHQALLQIEKSNKKKGVYRLKTPIKEE